MILNKSYGFWSTSLSVIGTLLLIATYLLAPDTPQGMIVVIIYIMQVLAIVLLPLGIIASIFAIKNKEIGIKKYTGILMPVLIILFIVLIPLLMAIGFMINDNP